MTLEALGNLGDFVGGIAVIATLLYLAVQVRQNSRQLKENSAATRAATYQAAMEVVATINLETSKHPELARFLVMSAEEFEALDAAGRIQVEGLHVSAIRANQQIYLQHRAGLIDEALWLSHAAGLRRVLRSSVMNEIWKRRRDSFAPDFAEFIDAIFEENAP